MITTQRCIVLRTVKYGDSQLIVDFLSRDSGRMSAVWRLPRGAKGKSLRNMFQPLTICDIIVEQKKQTGLPYIKDAHIALPYTSLHFDPVKMSVAFFLAEFLVQVSRAEQPDVAFYDFVESSLQWYDLTDSATANFHLMFLVRSLRFVGILPDVESHVDGSLFDLRSAEFCTAVPFHRDYLLTEDASRLETLMRMTPANMHYYRFSRDERNRTVEMLLRFYSLHVPGFKEMKSWEVLRAIFS